MSVNKILVRAALAASLVAGAAIAPEAIARPWHHGGVGIVIGAPFFGPYWGWGYGYPGYWGYPNPYYYPPAVGYADAPNYVERPDAAQAQAPAAPAAYYWYYCNSPDGYYPYVKACPAGWKKVVPTPPNAQ